MSSEANIRDQVAQNDVTIARSYFEVDVMEWFSRNKIPFGYEAFTIPSVVGPNQDEWSTMVDAIRFVGQRDFDGFDRITEGTRWEDMRPAELMATWEDIYDKHRLQEEHVTIEVARSLSGFDKQLMLPDFSLYLDAGTRTAGPDFDWTDWDYLVEVSGLWGVGLPDEATEADWWSWYRVSAVAFKELIYKLLDLWEDVLWVVPDQPFIEGVTDGIPNALRGDDHYIIVNTTSSEIGLDELADRIGVTNEAIVSDLSSPIELIQYERPATRELPAEFNLVEWEYDSINMENVDNNENTVIASDDFIVHHGDLGEVYVSNDSVHVRESQWRYQNMIMLREYVTNVIGELAEDQIIHGLIQVE